MTQKKTTILIRSAAVNGNVDTKFREIYFTLSKGNDFFLYRKCQGFLKRKQMRMNNIPLHMIGMTSIKNDGDFIH